MKAKLLSQESKAITTHLLFHRAEPDRAAGPPLDAWQAAEFFWMVLITPSSQCSFPPDHFILNDQCTYLHKALPHPMKSLADLPHL